MNEQEQEVPNEEESEEEEHTNLGMGMLRAIEGMIQGLQNAYRMTRTGWRGATAEKNPDNLKGKGITKAEFDFKKAKKRRKIQAKSRRYHNVKGSRPKK